MKFQRKPSVTATALGKASASRVPFGRAHRMHAVAFAAGIAGLGLVLTTVPALGASAAAHAGGKLSWSSGVYLSRATPASVSAFGTWRGAPVTVATVWPARSSWNDFIDPTWLYQRWQGSPVTVAFGEPMLPANAGASIQACAAGLLQFLLAPVRHQYLRLRPRQVDHQAGLGIQRGLVHLEG